MSSFEATEQRLFDEEVAVVNAWFKVITLSLQSLVAPVIEFKRKNDEYESLEMPLEPRFYAIHYCSTLTC
jgi:hypothetical protein